MRRVGISAGAHLVGVKSAMLMQGHGFLAMIHSARAKRCPKVPGTIIKASEVQAAVGTS